MTPDEISALIEVKRRELHTLAARANFNFQDEAVQLASQSLDQLLALWEASTARERRASAEYNRGSADIW